MTEALFGNKVRIDAEQTPWLPEGTIDLSSRSLKSNFLCRRHNGELGRTADAAALRVLRALRQALDPTKLPGARTRRAPVNRRVSGVRYAQWLCKTHCNLMVAAGYRPHLDYVRYAFGKPTGPIYFYCSGLLGESLRLGDARIAAVRYAQLVSDTEPGYDAFEISFGGLPMIVSPIPVVKNGQRLMDRMRVLRQDTPLGPYEILFDWTDDPSTESGAA